MKELRAIFCMTRAALALEIACDSRKQKLYRLNRPYIFGDLVIFSLNDRARAGKSGNKASTGALFCRSLKYLACDEWRILSPRLCRLEKG